MDKLVQDHEIPASLVNYMDVYRGRRIGRNLDLQTITATPDEHARFFVQMGDILFTPSSETPEDIGHSAVVVDDLTNTLHSYHTVRLRPDGEVPLDVGFSAYFANGEGVRQYFSRRAAGSTRYTLSLESFQRAQVDVPPLNQQRQIAEVLVTLDTAIEQTEALIAKTQQIKAGLMHDLFTRGVTPDGQLRPTREQAPQLYKVSPLGWIPTEWEVSELGSLCETASGGTPSRAIARYWGGAIPWLKTGEIDYSEIHETEEYITEEALDRSPAQLLPIGSVVMALFGQGFTRGRVAVLGIRACVNQACLALLPSPNVDTWFLYYSLTKAYWDLRALSNDGAQQNLNASLVKRFPILSPPNVEQEQIARRLKAIDSVLHAERVNSEKFRCTKRGLMHDLLTGRVRVPVDATEAVAAEA